MNSNLRPHLSEEDLERWTQEATQTTVRWDPDLTRQPAGAQVRRTLVRLWKRVLQMF